MKDSILNQNQKEWDDNVNEGDQYTKPWLHLTDDMAKKFANAEISGFHEPYGEIDNPLWKKIHRSIYANISGKRVLCLASGGGQQSALFSLLGAQVTVVDLSAGQLRGDIEASKFYGYKVETIQASMTDLSALAQNSFDLVFQPISICFVPDVQTVYREVYRITKPGGKYLVSHINPSTYPTCFENDIDGFDGVGYRIASPYLGGAIRYDANGKENMTEGQLSGEFRHLFIDMFCNLTESGFKIQYVWEDERNLVKNNRQKDIKNNDDFSVIQKYINILTTK